MAVAPSNILEEGSSSSRALVIGGGLAGLASASVLSDLFDEVILLERDAITEQVSPLPRMLMQVAVYETTSLFTSKPYRAGQTVT